MKKVLLATTALIAASVAAGQANAQAAQTKAPFTLKIDGFVSEYFGAVGYEGSPTFAVPNTAAPGRATSTRAYDFKTDSRILIDASATADNGLNYGVFIRINPTPSSGSNAGTSTNPGGATGGTTGTLNTVNADRANVYFNGKWGRLELGDQKSAVYKLFWLNFIPADYSQPYADGTGINNGGGFNGREGPLGAQFLSDPGVRTTIQNLSFLGAYTSDSNNATKITYMSPTLFGFAAGISYSPDGANRGGGTVARSNLTGGANNQALANPGAQTAVALTNYYDVLDIGINYKGSYDLGFGDVGFRTGLGWTHGSAKGNAAAVAATGTPIGGRGLSDMDSMYTGFRVDWFGATLGMGYTFNGKSGQALASTAVANKFHSDASGWAIGGQYKIGPWTAGGYYQYATSEGSVALVGSNKIQQLEFDVTYLLAPGLQLVSDVYNYNVHDDGGNAFGGVAASADRNGWVFIMGPAITF